MPRAPESFGESLTMMVEGDVFHENVGLRVATLRLYDKEDNRNQPAILIPKLKNKSSQSL